MGYLRVSQDMSSFKPLSNRISVKVFCFRGSVVADKKWSETDTFSRTTVYATGVGGRAGVVAGPRVQSVVTEVQEFFLRDGDAEIAVRLHNANFAIRPDHDVAVAWIVRSDQERGPFIWAYNFTTNEAANLSPSDDFILGAEYSFPKLMTTMHVLLFLLTVISVPLGIGTGSGPVTAVAMVLCGLSAWRIIRLIEVKKVFLSRLKERLAAFREAPRQAISESHPAHQEATG